MHNFITVQGNHGYKIMIYKCIQYILKESLLLLKDLLEPYPYSGWAFSGLLTDGGEQKGTPTVPKICHRYPSMMKLGTVIPHLKKIQKICESRDISPEFCLRQYFSSEISKFCYIKKYRYRLHFDT